MSVTPERDGRSGTVSSELLDVPSNGVRSRSQLAPGEFASAAASSLDPASTPRPEVEPRANDIANADRWAQFEDIGLVPSPATQAAQKLVVSTYRLAGLVILTVVVGVLVGYIAITAFYFFSRTWVAPIAISPNDEQVIALRSQLAAQVNERARLAGELEQAERAVAAEQSFQLQFMKAIEKDLRGRKVALGRARELSNTAAATRHEIRATNGDYSTATVARMAEEYAAGMIDRQEMLAGKFQLAQISAANLTLAERQAEFDQRAADLAAQTQSLDAVLADKTSTAALSYDVLTIARQYEDSKLALAREISNRERLKGSLARQDVIIAGLQQSAYLRAITDRATVALVPYSNLGNAGKGTPLYSCRLEMLFCHEVGKVIEVLPGEVQVRHPTRDTMFRGRMIEMHLTDPAAAEEMLLFAGGPPLGF
jgi:hypothetical protein